jgi:hypothetical protein
VYALVTRLKDPGRTRPTVGLTVQPADVAHSVSFGPCSGASTRRATASGPLDDHFHGKPYPRHGACRALRRYLAWELGFRSTHAGRLRTAVPVRGRRWTSGVCRKCVGPGASRDTVARGRRAGRRYDRTWRFRMREEGFRASSRVRIPPSPLREGAADTAGLGVAAACNLRAKSGCQGIAADARGGACARCRRIRWALGTGNARDPCDSGHALLPLGPCRRAVGADPAPADARLSSRASARRSATGMLASTRGCRVSRCRPGRLRACRAWACALFRATVISRC